MAVVIVHIRYLQRVVSISTRVVHGFFSLGRFFVDVIFMTDLYFETAPISVKLFPGGGEIRVNFHLMWFSAKNGAGSWKGSYLAIT